MNQSAQSFTRNALPNFSGIDKSKVNSKVGTHTSISSMGTRVVNNNGIQEPTDFLQGNIVV